MSIVKMKRLRLLGLLTERDELLNKLLALGCVEITETADKLADSEYAELLRRGTSDFSGARNENIKLNSALTTLEEHASLKSKLFLKRREITEEEFFSSALWNDTLAIADKINSLEREISRLYADESKQLSLKESLVPWQSLDIPIETGGTVDTSVFFGMIPSAHQFSEMEVALAEAADLVHVICASSDKEQHYFIVIYHKTVAETVFEVMRKYAYSSASFKDMTGTASDNILAIEAKMAEIKAEIENCSKEIASYADKRDDLRLCIDRSVQEMARESAKDRLLSTDSIYSLEGWATEPKAAALAELFSSYTCAWELSEPEDDDVVPTLLHNSKFVDPINMVTEMYSLPDYKKGIDPNPLMFPFFIFFYSMMFADMAYGTIMFLACLIIKKKFKPKGTLGHICGLGVIIGIVTAIFGFFTGGCFGDAIPVFCETFLGMPGVELWCIINPLEDPMTILVFGIVLGCIHMIFGQCIHIYIGFRDNKGIAKLDNILDVIPWWVVFAGVGLLVLKGSAILLIIGVVSLIATQGRHKKGIFGKLFGGVASLYDVTSWLGDILSYARLMALMLATTVIASVVNILGSLAGSLLVFIPVFLFGHTFNIGINVIGTYVHAARLQYLEFFGKFYEGGGVPFDPLKYNTKYVDIVPSNQGVK